MVETMHSRQEEPSALPRRRAPRGPLRGALKIETEAEIRHVATCLGRLAAELHIRGFLADPPPTLQNQELAKEAA